MRHVTSLIDDASVPSGLRPAVSAIAGVARTLSETIARNGLSQDLGRSFGLNSDGDRQKALDVIADEAFRDALAEAGLRHYASEELAEPIELAGSGEIAVAIDPLDGSSNIDVNVSIGTIFGFYPAERTPERSFLRPGRDQIGAGYVIYGPQTAMVLTFGCGTLKFVLDRDLGAFRLVEDGIQVPRTATEYAINASNYRHWQAPIRSYIDDCLAGAEGPRAKDFNMRWIASLVAETHRVMTRGGIFLYPADARPGYERGRLRQVYECAPIAMLMEQAGGKATDGQARILDRSAASLHERTPFVFGSAEKVDRVAAYHEDSETTTSALFGERGLFRV